MHPTHTTSIVSYQYSSIEVVYLQFMMLQRSKKYSGALPVDTSHDSQFKTPMLILQINSGKARFAPLDLHVCPCQLDVRLLVLCASR